MSPELRALALYDAVSRCGGNADWVMQMTLLDRRLTASIAGVNDANDQDWTLVLQLFRAKEETPSS